MNATETTPYRIHSCACGHAWADPVTASAETPNLSGEPTPYCPECGARASESSPVVPDTMPRWTDGTGYKRHPQKIKRAMDMAGKAAALRHYQRALSGVRGGDESRAMHALLMGLGRESFASQSPKVALEYWRIGERYGWRFDRSNVETIGRECAALAVRVAHYDGDRAGDLLTWDDCRRDPDEEAKRQAAIASAEADRAAAKAEAEARRAALVELRDRIAPGCAGVVVAELVQDESDLMSDYHGHRTVRTVAVGFTKSTRDRFDWMRNAARNSADPRIAAMADLSAEHEHRNKWSMGAGYFIAEPNARGFSSDDNSGWKLRIRALDSLGDMHDVPEIDPGLLAPSKRAEALADYDVPTGQEDYTDAAGYMTPTETWPECQTAPAGAYSIETHHHTKQGRDMVMVCPAGKDLSRDDFKAWTDDAKTTGGWYSRKWGTTPGGWAWWADADGEAKAAAFALAHYGAGDPGPDGAPAEDPASERRGPTPTEHRAKAAADAAAGAGAKRAALAAGKVRGLAERLDSEAADKLAPRQENTAKRQAQAASARIDGQRAQRAAHYLQAWADAAEGGALPEVLLAPPTKAEALQAAAKPTEQQPNGFHPIPWEVTDPQAWHYSEPRHVALRALVEVDHARAEANAREAARARALAELRGSDIPGFFPTPDRLADRMAELGELRPGDIVGDLGAGIGSLLLAALRAEPGIAGAVGYEVAPRLAAYCADHVDRGGSPWVAVTCYDGLQAVENGRQNTGAGYRPDVVLINPPYEKLQHLDHVRAAYEWARRRVVALVPANVRRMVEDGQTGGRQKVADFVGWAQALSISWEDVDPAAFKGADAFRQAGVATVLLVIDKG